MAADPVMIVVRAGRGCATTLLNGDPQRAVEDRLLSLSPRVS
jgi:hypothetical protein